MLWQEILTTEKLNISYLCATVAANLSRKRDYWLIICVGVLVAGCWYCYFFFKPWAAILLYLLFDIV